MLRSVVRFHLAPPEKSWSRALVFVVVEVVPSRESATGAHPVHTRLLDRRQVHTLSGHRAGHVTTVKLVALSEGGRSHRPDLQPLDPRDPSPGCRRGPRPLSWRPSAAP